MTYSAVAFLVLLRRVSDRPTVLSLYMQAFVLPGSYLFRAKQPYNKVHGMPSRLRLQKMFVIVISIHFFACSVARHGQPCRPRAILQRDGGSESISTLCQLRFCYSDSPSVCICALSSCATTTPCHYYCALGCSCGLVCVVGWTSPPACRNSRRAGPI